MDLWFWVYCVECIEAVYCVCSMAFDRDVHNIQKFNCLFEKQCCILLIYRYSVHALWTDGGGGGIFLYRVLCVSTLYKSVICPCTSIQLYCLWLNTSLYSFYNCFYFRLCMPALTMAEHGRRWIPIYRTINGNQYKDWVQLQLGRVSLAWMEDSILGKISTF